MAVSDMWHRTLVYFGMADDSDDYDEEYDDDDAHVWNILRDGLAYPFSSRHRRHA